MQSAWKNVGVAVVVFLFILLSVVGLVALAGEDTSCHQSCRGLKSVEDPHGLCLCGPSLVSPMTPVEAGLRTAGCKSACSPASWHFGSHWECICGSQP
jgi:hypothetical protein